MEQQLAKLVKDVAEHKRIIKELNDDNKQIAELLHGIYQLTVDISKKQDEWLNIGLKKPKTKQSKSKHDNDSEEKDDDCDKQSTNESENVEDNANADNKKKPKGKKAETEKKNNDKKKESRVDRKAYFKKKYKENTHYFDNILDENAITDLLNKNKDKIESKKTEMQQLTEKANIIYSSLTNKQKDAIKKMLMDESETSAETENIILVNED